MEQQRDFKLRHPSYQMTHDEALQKHRTGVGWSIAPVLIVLRLACVVHFKKTPAAVVAPFSASLWLRQDVEASTGMSGGL